MTKTTPQDNHRQLPYARFPQTLRNLKQQFDAFFNELVETSLSPDVLGTMRCLASIDDVASVLRSLPALEGKLIELGIAAVASCNPDLKVLTQNLRLPVLPTALQSWSS
jgi:hypothetical protein